MDETMLYTCCKGVFRKSGVTVQQLNAALAENEKVKALEADKAELVKLLNQSMEGEARYITKLAEIRYAVENLMRKLT